MRAKVKIELGDYLPMSSSSWCKNLTVLDVIRERGSVRRYEDRSIPTEAMEQVLEAARLGQSAANRQPWEFVVVVGKDTKKKIASASESFVAEATAVIVCIAHPENCGHVGSLDSFLVDVAIAVENMALVSWELGLGSCWIGAYDEEEIRQILNIPENLRVASLLTLGYPAEKPEPQAIRNRRKSLSQIVHYEKYKK
jgi:nitroreductase